MHRPASLPPAVCFLLPRGQSALPSFAHLTILQSKTWNNDDSGNADILQKQKREKMAPNCSVKLSNCVVMYDIVRYFMALSYSDTVAVILSD